MKSNTLSVVKRVVLVLMILVAVLLLACGCGCKKDASCENGHAWDAGVPTAEDCTKILYTCTNCQETKTETAEGKTHDYQVVTIEATCTQNGSVTSTCKNCQASVSTPILAAHTLNETVVEATCFANGSRVNACSKCNYKETTTILASHNYKEETINATCTKDGSKVFTCEGCGDSYRNVFARATGHNTEGKTWTVKDELVEGCLYNHVETTTCNTCGEEVTHTTEINKHDYYVTIQTSATCQSAGLKVRTCKECDDSEEIEYENSEAHAWDDGQIDGNITIYACQVLGCTETKTLFSAKNEVSASVPSDALQSAGAVELLNATVNLDEDVLKQLDGADVTISAETLDSSLKDAIINAMSEADREKLGNGEIFNFLLEQNGSLVSSFDGKIKITIPFTLEDGMDPDNIAVWYIDENGAPSTFNATYTEINGTGYAVFETNHFSYYTVIRMSPAERCAFYGHKYDSTVVPASCNQQGYTLDVCKMCHDVVRHTFTTALTHNYTKSATVDATCLARGYSMYTCSNCSDKYVSDYTAILAHDYERTEHKATCTEKGYILNKCKACGFAYTENETSITDHVYKDGACVTCGKKATSAGNMYLTAIDSLINANSFLFNIDNLTFSASMNDKIMQQTVVNNLKAYVKIDALGKLYGTGDCDIVVTVNNDGELETQSTKGKVLFQNGNMYVYVYLPDYENEYYYDVVDPNTAKDQLVYISQDAILERMFGMPSLPIDEEMIETVRSIWESMLNTSKNPLNGALTKIISFIYLKEATESGYTYKFNPVFIKIAYSSIKEEKINVLYDKVFGEGAYDATVEFLKGAFEKTIPQLESEAKTELSKWGITADVIYALIEEKAGTSIDDMLAEMGEVQLYMLINQMTEEETTPEEYVSMVEQYDSMLKEYTLYDLAISMMGDLGEMEEAEDPIAKIINDIVEACQNATIQFTTDKNGEFISMSTVYNKLVYNYTMGEETTSVYVDGAISFVINETDFTDHSALVNDQEIINEAISGLDESLHTSVKKNSVDLYRMIYSIIPCNGDLYVWFYGDTMVVDEISKETVTMNGKQYEKSLVLVEDLYKVDKGCLSSSSDCEGWKNIRLETHNSFGDVQLYVWKEVTEDLNSIYVRKIEFADPTIEYEFDGNYESVNLYYSASTKEYSLQTSHTFKLVETVQPNGCEYGYRRYECSVCGASYKQMFGEGHRRVRLAELLEGSTTCLDGVKIKNICEKCGDVGYTYTTKYHETVEKKTVIEVDTICGDIWLMTYECACGEELNYSRIESDHVFDYFSHENGYDVRKCAEESCGITYKYKQSGDYSYYPEREETCWFTKTEELIIQDKSYIFTDTYATHSTSWKWSEDSTIEYSYCSLCQKTLSERRYDSYGRTIYYKSYGSGYYYTRNFNGCDYEQTTHYEDGDVSTETGTIHAGYEYTTVIEETCSQYGLESRRCILCGDVDYNTVIRPYYWDNYYWGSDFHNWNYNEELGVYECNECGTKSTLGADGMIILEDMSSVGEFKVGYFNKNEYNMQEMVDFELILNYQDEQNPGIAVEDSLSYMTIQDTTIYDDYDYSSYRRESGIVTIDLDALADYIAAQDEEIKTVSFVAWVLCESKTQVDENGNPVEYLLAHAITFELSELYE